MPCAGGKGETTSEIVDKKVAELASKPQMMPAKTPAFRAILHGKFQYPGPHTVTAIGSLAFVPSKADLRRGDPNLYKR